MKYIYNLLISAMLPFALLRLLWRSRRNPDYRKRLGERITLNRTETCNAIWIHTVSVGEFLATLPLIEKLLVNGESLLITTTTPTGSAMVQEKLGKRVAHQYLPFDVSFLVKRFLRKAQPRVAVFVETEIWSNYLSQLKKNNVPALLINARLSERSFNGYQKLGKFARDAVSNFTEVACQNTASCQRFLALGATATTIGNMKFDLSIPSDLATQTITLKQKIGERRFILVASTHKGEEDIIINAYQNSDENRLLVIAPRNPERTSEVVALAKKLNVTAERHTKTEHLAADTNLLIIDALGQLLTFFSLADYAIIGGSFVPHGGHNPLEASLFATPCVTGKYFFNFEDLINAMQTADAISIIDEKSLFTQSPDAVLGTNAQKFLAENQGATDKYKALIYKMKK